MTLLINQMNGFGVKTKAPANIPTITRLGGQASTTASSSSRTITGAALGTASADRAIIVVIHHAATGHNPTGVTIGGISASLLHQNGSNGFFYGAVVPTGTTGNIVVSLASAVTSSQAIQWFSMTGWESLTPVWTIGESDPDGYVTSSTTFNTTFDPPRGASIFAIVGYKNSGSTGPDFSSVTPSGSSGLTVKSTFCSNITDTAVITVDGSSFAIGATATQGTGGILLRCMQVVWN